MSHEKTAIKTVYFSIISNASLALIKWLAGFFGHSYALIADAIESTSDIFSSILVLIGIKISNKPADKNHPYGHGRVEPLVTFAVVGFLVVSAIIIARQSIINIQTPHHLPKFFTLIILGIFIVWKEISYRFVIKKSKETKSSSLRADAWHHRSDAVISSAAFIGITLALIFNYPAADDWAALIASMFILYNSYHIFRPALGEIMDEYTHDDVVNQIRAIAQNVGGVVDTEKCFIRKTGMKYHVDLHITVNSQISVKEGHDISHKVSNKLKETLPELSNVLIHIEPNDD